MSEQNENTLMIIAAFILYGIVGGMEMREQQELKQAQYVAVIKKPPKPKPKPPEPKPHQCKLRTNKDSCIVRLA